ncbi:nucleoside-diphosphate-sugar epimerase [Streptacidiphilus sp. MAP12-20]|uniref:NAD-dependent epimerase/dehydratase family protein n=1 Tax=Streptacidiphilus sp. MAP12-20 TaxID=3156299 RepID=UPI0035116499
MRILVLGGTAFVGRAIVAEALDGGAEVTLFGRGKTGAELFPEASRLVGDRDTGDYTALRGGSWDAVVDVSGYLPRQVGQAMDALGDRVGRYVFISSTAVYQEEGVGPGADEDTPRRPPVRTVEQVEDLDNATYGPSKVACEDDVLARYGERATIVRPGQLVGPHDHSDLFTYWVRRAARGGRVALPGDPEQPVQVLDVRDLAGLVRRLVEDERPGVFNAVGPAEPTTLGGLVRSCARAAGTEVDLVRIPAELAPRFPLVRAAWATQQRDAARARAAGLPATPLSQTAADVLAWDRDRGEPPLTCGFSPEQEAAVLADPRPGGARI